MWGHCYVYFGPVVTSALGFITKGISSLILSPVRDVPLESPLSATPAILLLTNMTGQPHYARLQGTHRQEVAWKRFFYRYHLAC